MNKSNIDAMNLDAKNERPVELNEIDLKMVNGGSGSKMICTKCGAETTDPQVMKKWRLAVSNHDGVAKSICDKCSKYGLKVGPVAHEE